jgi:hypothetical protein
MSGLVQSADMTVYPYVVRWISENELCAFAAEQTRVRFGLHRIAAEHEVVSDTPEIAHA